MPGSDPLTGTPYQFLAESANIETAAKPGFLHLARFAIPRFASVGARTTAFAHPDATPPDTGQVTFVTGRGYEAWNGSAWIPFLRLAGHPEEAFAFKPDSDQRTSTTFAVDPDLSVSVESNTVYRFRVHGFHNGPDGDNLMVQMRGPANSTISFGGYGSQPGTGVGGSGTAFEGLSVLDTPGDNPGNHILFKSIVLGGGDHDAFELSGMIEVGSTAGNLALWWRSWTGGQITLHKHSHLIVVRPPQ